jgi:CBS domain-containing protein
MPTDQEDEYDRWMNSPEEPDYAGVFNETLGSLQLTSPITVESSTTIVQAIEIMNQHSIGCVLIVDEGQLNGIFTERDVLRRVALLELDLSVTPISKVMTRNPECLTSDDLLLHALNCMVVGGFRHVPVLERGEPIGVFGMRDCVRYVVELQPEAVLNAPPPGMKASFRPEGG